MCSGSSASNRDHPRVCGEHVSCELDGFAVQGSSPRMRGTPTNDYDFDTPRRDHPRVCGEHVPAIAPTAPPTGSSPRMRGTRSVGRAVRGGLGIIPAYAGNTSSAWLCMIRIRDHPRVCGEHYFRVVWVSESRGSSPRMRGTPEDLAVATASYGIIPAYAGNTISGASGSSMVRIIPAYAGNTLVHSPPPKARGIIPAYAGNTRARLAV